MERFGLGLLPYFPLASGLLTGKYRRNATLPEGARLTETQRLAERYLTDRHWPVVERLQDFCDARGHTMVELAFSWLLRPRPGRQRDRGRHAGRPGAAERCRRRLGTLSADDLAEIDRITAA